MTYDALELLKLFDFSDSRESVEAFLGALPSYRGLTSIRQSGLRDLIMLSGAEIAAVRASLNPEQNPVPLAVPIKVMAEDGNLAVAETDCGLWDVHAPQTREDVALWDTMLYAGDMSKAALLIPAGAPTSGGLPVQRFHFTRGSDLARLALNMEERYRRVGGDFANALAKSGLIRLRGLIWQAKFEVLTGSPMDYDSMHVAVRELDLLGGRQ